MRSLNCSALTLWAAAFGVEFITPDCVGRHSPVSQPLAPWYHPISDPCFGCAHGLMSMLSEPGSRALRGFRSVHWPTNVPAYGGVLVSAAWVKRHGGVRSSPLPASDGPAYRNTAALNPAIRLSRADCPPNTGRAIVNGTAIDDAATSTRSSSSVGGASRTGRLHPPGRGRDRVGSSAGLRFAPARSAGPGVMRGEFSSACATILVLLTATSCGETPTFSSRLIKAIEEVSVNDGEKTR